MAFNFSDDPAGPSGEPPTSVPTPTSAESPPSKGVARFTTCRWQQPAEDGNAAFCTHREVKPMAGMNDFDADAWCTDCEYYKLRRVPKKRPPEERW